jgi:hypothetical protein
VPEQLRTLVNVPLFHVTGEVPVMLNSFVIKRCLVLMRKWDPGEALRLMEKERITYFVGVPTMSLELMQHPDRDKYDLSNLTDIAAGGAARPVDHVRRLKQTFATAQPAIGYGLTETNAVGCGNVWSNYAEKPDSTGRATQPFVELAILGEDGAHLPTGERGEVAIRSAANIQLYWRDPEATAEAFTADGFLKTGDIGMLDEDGYLFIVDRKKDIIIRGGENISCVEVEAAIYAHEAVAEASVFGVPCERLGEQPAAAVHFKEGQAVGETRCARPSRRGSPPSRCRRSSGSRPIPAQARHRQDRQGAPARAFAGKLPAEALVLPRFCRIWSVPKRILWINNGLTSSFRRISTDWMHKSPRTRQAAVMPVFPPRVRLFPRVAYRGRGRHPSGGAGPTPFWGSVFAPRSPVAPGSAPPSRPAHPASENGRYGRTSAAARPERPHRPLRLHRQRQPVMSAPSRS